MPCFQPTAVTQTQLIPCVSLMISPCLLHSPPNPECSFFLELTTAGWNVCHLLLITSRLAYTMPAQQPPTGSCRDTTTHAAKLSCWTWARLHRCAGECLAGWNMMVPTRNVWGDSSLTSKLLSPPSNDPLHSLLIRQPDERRGL